MQFQSSVDFVSVISLKIWPLLFMYNMLFQYRVVFSVCNLFRVLADVHSISSSIFLGVTIFDQGFGRLDMP